MQKRLLAFFAALTIAQMSVAQTVLPLYETGKIPNSKPHQVQEITHTFLSNGQSVRFIVKISVPELTVYLPEKKKNTGMAVIICPGGGYAGVAIDHEGHDMAKKLAKNGIAGFVLKYRMPDDSTSDHKEIVPLQDAQRALQMVRENAKKWRINPKKIGIAGSSAGGHLAATAGTHYAVSQIKNPKNTSLRPDFMILNYPVISFADSLTHYGSRFNLIGVPEPTEKQKTALQTTAGAKIKYYSNELQVNADTPPTFITHAVDDDVVKVENSVLFAAALQQHKVPVATFFYAKGGHGYGMDNPTADVDWMDNCLAWLLKMAKAK